MLNRDEYLASPRAEAFRLLAHEEAPFEEPFGACLAVDRVEVMRGRMSAAEVFGDWDGEYEFPEDLPRGVGDEVDWGEPVGGEMW